MVVYLDKSIVICNKPAGLPVQPGADGGDSLSGRLQKEHGRLYVVHRIDTPSSGIVLLARTKAAAAALSAQFSTGTVEKRYICAADAALPAKEGSLTSYINTGSGRKNNRVRVFKEERPGAKKAVLRYTELYRTDRYFIFGVLLETGRKHQIRAQFAAEGSHIKGDLKYGARRSNPGGGINLHALSLVFRHPDTGEKVSFSAPLPDDPVWKAVPVELINGFSAGGQHQEDQQSSQDNGQQRDDGTVEPA